MALLRAMAIVLVSAATAHAQARPLKPLSGAKRVSCSFPLMATGTWDDAGGPKAEVKPATLKVAYDSIDTDDGTARLLGPYGNVSIIAKLSLWSLHLLQMGAEGALNLTTVFDRQIRPGHFNATHTVHEYTQVLVPGFTSRPEQYYGECAVEW